MTNAGDQDKSSYVSCHKICTKKQAVPGKVTKYLHLWSGFTASALHFEVNYCKQHGERYKLFHPVNFVKTSKSNVELIYDSSGLLDFQILFIGTTQKLWTQLRAVATSPMSGYLTAPGYLLCPTPLGMNVSHTISLPEGHSVIISFSRFKMRFSVDIFTLSDHYRHGIITNNRGDYRGHESSISIFNTSVEVNFISVYHSIGFKLLFSFHTHNSLPRRLSKLVFNCSVPHYDRFKQHVECNLRRECHAGEDEGGHCPFSSKACRGYVAVAEKCYVPYKSWNQFSWLDNRAFCHEKGGRMVIVRSKEEEHALLELLRSTTRSFGFNVGLMLSGAVPNLYRHTPMWIDYTAAYTTPYIFHVPYSGMLGFEVNFNIYSISLEVKNVISGKSGTYICEHALRDDSHSSAKSASTMVNTVQFNNTLTMTSEESTHNSLSLLIVCPAGHRTHDFLKCDREADCLEKQYELTKCPVTTSYKKTVHTKDGRGTQPSQVATVAMFQCDLVLQTLPYTLVCNFLPDCIDSSDETFCRHAQCMNDEHRCGNGQCLDVRRRTNVKCDRVVDCYDGSDEAMCSIDQSLGFTTVTLSPPARIDHTQDYFPIATPLETPHTCPQSHFSCPGNFGYCLPMYVLCNRYYDCPNREDEADCENYLCPGHYRCRGSTVCLHVTHLCDGVVQCQDQDDEALCDFACPQNCHCQGLAFLCPQPFPAANFPQLRYLDATHSAINFSLLQRNTYLVWLSLRHCRLRELSNNSFVNLQFLDLSHNMIQTLSVVFIETLDNLKEIRLSQNPIESMTTRGVLSRHPTGLQRLDISVTRLAEFDCDVFSSFPDVIFLNLSYCYKVSVTRKGFQCFPFLREVDVRGTHTKQSELSLFMGLQFIELIFSDNYRHCCSGVLPKVSHSLFCFAPSTGYSSCSHLLRFNLHRVFASILAILSLLGSVCSLLGHHLHGKQHSSSRPLDICVLSLISADLMMGIYLIIIVSGDVRFHGNFLWHERDWTLSVSCKTAHFVAFVSTEVSCFTCLWIVIDRLTALRSPSNRLRDRSAYMACLVSWLTALCLAIVPVLSPEASWEAGGHSSLCLPMAMLGDEDHRYTASVLGVLNSVTAFIAAICFFLVYYEVRSNYVIATSSQISQDMVMARRVMTIVLTDVIYWSGIGVLTIISCLAPSAVVSDVMTLMLIVGVPLKPVVSPFLYLNGLVRERRKMVEESRLVSLLERRLRWPAVRGQPSAPQVARTERQETRTQSNQMGRLDMGQSGLSAHDRQTQPQVIETLSAEGRKTQSRVESQARVEQSVQTTLLFRKTSTSQSAVQSSDRASHQWPASARDEDVLRFLTRCFDSNTLQPDDVQTMLDRFQNQRPH